MLGVLALGLCLVLSLDVVSAAVAWRSRCCSAAAAPAGADAAAADLARARRRPADGAEHRALYGRPSGGEWFDLGFAHVTDGSLELALATALRVLAVGLRRWCCSSASTRPTSPTGSRSSCGCPRGSCSGALAAVRMTTLLGEDWRQLAMARDGPGGSPTPGACGVGRRWHSRCSCSPCAVRRRSRSRWSRAGSARRGRDVGADGAVRGRWAGRSGRWWGARGDRTRGDRGGRGGRDLACVTAERGPGRGRGAPLVLARRLAAMARAASRSPGSPRRLVVLVDGRSGTGKTTLGTALAAELGTAAVHSTISTRMGRTPAPRRGRRHRRPRRPAPATGGGTGQRRSPRTGSPSTPRPLVVEGGMRCAVRASAPLATLGCGSRRTTPCGGIGRSAATARSSLGSGRAGPRRRRPSSPRRTRRPWRTWCRSVVRRSVGTWLPAGLRARDFTR